MTLLEWVLVYLLTGFVMFWSTTVLAGSKVSDHWCWEMAGVLLWPLVILLVLIRLIHERVTR